MRVIIFKMIKAIEVLKNFSAWAKANPKLVKLGLIIGGVVAVVGPLLIMVGLMTSAVSTLIPVIIALSGPLGLILLTFGAVTNAIYQIIKAWPTLKEQFTDSKFIQSVIDKIKILVGWFKQLIEYQNKIISTVSQPFKKGAEAFSGIKEKITGGFKNIFSGALDVNINAPKGVVNQISTRTKGKNVALGTNLREA